MWSFLIFVVSISVAESQLDRRENGQAWDIKLPVPGDPGGDYPTLNSIPRTSFTCAGKEAGYYADQETNCQVFKVCTAGSTYGFQSFLCPNGTLFNQAVSVCDWWMNVDCAKSQEIINNKQKLGNFKLGPQFIKEIKKMITHPLRNPYDTGYYKNNLVVMQEYQPPTEQFYSNGNFIKNNEKFTSNIYVPSKGQYLNFGQYLHNDINFAASTAAPQYISSFNSIERNRVQNAKINTFQNSRNGYLALGQAESTTSPQYNYAKSNAQNNPRQPYTQYNQNYNTQTKYTEFNSIKQPNTPVNNYNNGGQINTEAKQNLVSSEVTPTIISKTIAIKTIVPGEKPGRQKSRITFKTWILKPKNAKLTVESASNDLNHPTPTSLEKLSSSFEPYVYNKPIKALDVADKNSYAYKKPTVNTFGASTESYKSRLYEAPTTFRPIIPSKLYLPPETQATISERPINEISSTYQSLQDTFVPPTESAKLSRQYLLPIIASQKSQFNKNAKLVAASSSQSPQFEYFNKKPTITVTKQSLVNTNYNNVSFTDVHTKEKLDVTVNDVIKSTHNKPIVTRPKQLAQYRNVNKFDTFLSNSQSHASSREELSSQFPAIKSKSSKLIASPSSVLQPPLVKVSNYMPSNKLLNLPYYKEPTNTIERTVSIKITIPEKIAKYLFKNESNGDSDDFEILNTGSSNYLVYANNLAAKTDASLTPIGKLSLIKNSNISNSQDLVFSFLADSLNAAKKYNSIAKENIVSTSTTPLQQNYRNNDAQRITNNISQLTSSQYSVNSFGQKNIQPLASQDRAKAVNSKNAQSSNLRQQNDFQKIRSQQLTKPSQPHTTYRSPSPTRQNFNNLQNTRQIYSGQLYQLPVPEVTRDYYNSPYIQQNNQAQRQISYIPQNIQQQLPNNDVEIIPSQQLPFNTYQQTSTFQGSSNDQSNPSKELNNLIRSGTGITAQLKDSIVGTLAHPTEKDKLVKYKKDQSYYIFSQVNQNDHENNRINDVRAGQLTRQNGNNNDELQFIPSVAYNLNNEKDQQEILNTFKINDFGVPQGTAKDYKNPVQRQDISTNIDYTINHPPSNFGDKISSLKSLYDGPSSYYNAPQTLYNFGKGQAFVNNDKTSKIEDLEDNEPIGYPKISPSPKFET